ncbi:hypothetical protein [Streptomyces sp. NPDC127038]|uniref:hypothetical protein n=1 Tax=Streptomyces sp. NPDC127038 TaxID=3347114 RepID=UPI003662D0E8
MLSLDSTRRSKKLGCTSERVRISDATARELFSRAAAHCQNPKCARDVLVEVGDGRVSIAEMAHIVAAIEKGPRGNSPLTDVERAGFANLALLCASCHTIVDKSPDQFPIELMLEWKKTHETRIKELFGTRKVGDRAEARAYVLPIFRENKQIFDIYGPAGSGGEDWAGDRFPSWSRKMLTRIIPNNRRILNFADLNRDLLTENELLTIEEFRQHADDLEARHVHHIYEVNGKRFPEAMSYIFESEG